MNPKMPQSVLPGPPNRLPATLAHSAEETGLPRLFGLAEDVVQHSDPD